MYRSDQTFAFLLCHHCMLVDGLDIPLAKNECEWTDEENIPDRIYDQQKNIHQTLVHF